MTRRVWFWLVDGEGNAVTSASSVRVSDEDVDALRKGVKKECPNALANVDAADLTVFANRTAYDLKRALEVDSPIGSFGGSMKDAIIVQVPGVNEGSWDSSLDMGWSFLYVAGIILLCISAAFGQDPSLQEGPLVARVAGGLFFLIGFVLLDSGLSRVGKVVNRRWCWIKKKRLPQSSEMPVLPPPQFTSFIASAITSARRRKQIQSTRDITKEARKQG